MKKRVRKTKKNIKKTMNPQMPTPQNTNHSSFFKNPIFISVIISVILLATVYFFLTNRGLKNQQIKPPSQTGLKQASPSASPSFSNLITDDVPKPAPDGRNIYYFITDGKGKLLPYSGQGYYEKYIVGSFLKWEENNSSQDKYLALSYSGSAKGAESIKVKVNSRTKLTVEDPTPFVKPTPGGVGPLTFPIGTIGQLSQTEIDKLIKAGDTIIVVVQGISNNQAASEIIIRRFDAKKVIEDELGKSIPLK